MRPAIRDAEHRGPTVMESVIPVIRHMAMAAIQQFSHMDMEAMVQPAATDHTAVTVLAGPVAACSAIDEAGITAIPVGIRAMEWAAVTTE